jgi:hypothetical protein
MNSFQHRQSAHCETGVIASLLTHAGLPMSEPMAFGLGSGLAFAYLPLVKVSGQPLIAYRMPPLYIIRTLCRRLGIKLHTSTYRNPERGQAALNDCLDQGRLVGLQCSVYWLPYFPQEMRFHFNAHNLLVYGREDSDYLISDPVAETVVRCPQDDLTRARFARGALAPKGRMYHIDAVPQAPDWKKLIATSLISTTRILDSLPLPWIGVRGIAYLGRRIAALDPTQHKANSLYLTHIVRMQEEIGTGGAGFRFMYASFLQESSALLQVPELAEIAGRMTATGDQWRQFALDCVQYSRQREMQPALQPIADQLHQLAASERQLMKDLAAIAVALK